MAIIKTAKVWLGGAAGVTAPITVSQYDSGWQFQFAVYNGSMLYNPGVAVSVTLEGDKPDGTAFAIPGTFADGVATIDTTEDVAQVAGVVKCELRVSAEGATVGTANFDVVVEAAPLAEHVVSEDNFAAMQALLDDVSEASADAIQAASDAGAAASAAAAAAATAQVQAGMAYKIANTAADMIDHDVGYVYVGSEAGYTFGGWYYWDGAAWTLGGTAVDSTLSVAGAAADARAVGNSVGAVHEHNEPIDYTVTESEKYINNVAVGNTVTLTSSSSYSYRKYSVNGVTRVMVSTYSRDTLKYYVYFVDVDDTIIARDMYMGATSMVQQAVDVPVGAVAMYVNYGHKTIGHYGAMTVTNIGKIALQDQIDALGTSVQDQIDDINVIIDPTAYAAAQIGDGLLETARETVLKLNKANLCLNFAYITDTHSNSSALRSKYNLELFAKAANEKWMEFAAHGGDLITVTNTTTQGDYFRDVGVVLEPLGKIGLPVYVSQGNHDVNGKNSADEVIMPPQWYAMFKPMSQVEDFRTSAVYSGYYFVDYKDVNLRVIVLDYHYGYDEDTHQEHSGIYGAQLKWFCEEALNLTDKTTPTDWAVVILTHIITNNTSAPVWEVLSAFINGTAISGGDYSFDYSDQGAGAVAGIIHGHNHVGEYEVIGGVNVIGVPCGYTSASDPISTDDFCFDVFTINPTAKTIDETRIGRGTSRSFVYPPVEE